MVKSFIEQVVNSILNDHQDVSKITFILPSKRAGSFLLKKLSQNITKPIFSPQIFSIEEFVEHVSGLKPANNTQQLFTLYSAYKSHTPHDELEPFDSFCNWAQIILQDFNEIDRFLVDQKHFFDYLQATKKLEQWSPEKQPTSLITNYLNFWDKLALYYDTFCELLEKEHSGHQGLLYRKAADDIEIYIEKNPLKKHVFLGFNALNLAEQHIIQALLAAGHTDIYWDTDAFFINNPIHEASSFLKQYKEKWSYFSKNPFKWISENYTKPKNFNVVSAVNDIDQIKHVGHILSDLSSAALKNTAVVLGDETLLIPLLNSLPSNVSTVNITMGIKLSQTPIASFFSSLFTLHKTANHKGFYHKELIHILNHFCSHILLEGKEKYIIENIRAHNLVYISSQKLLQLCDVPELMAIIASWENKTQLALQSCQKLITLLRQKINADNDPILFEYIYGFFKVFNKLEALINLYDYIDNTSVLERFYKETLSQESVDLRGDPYEGLQIMGVLESRVLDFQNVIITSVNEGTLPSGKSVNSYIPYDIKIAHELPTYQEKDAVYAYHFYKLLHRVENAYLLYTTASSSLGSNEKSRFISQIEIEGPHKINHIAATSSIVIHEISEESIKKSPDIIARLSQLGAHGFSPSALTTYLRNPLDYYYKYVLGVKENNSVEETVAANTMGTIVHNTLEELYKPYVKTLLSVEIIELLLQKVEAEALRQYQNAYPSTTQMSGKNLIIFNVIKSYVEKYIKLQHREIKNGKAIVIKSVEQDLKVPFSENINLRGKVDLVQQHNEELQIVDYKTGKVSSADLTIRTWDELLEPEGKREKAFQVLMYAYMLNKSQKLTFPLKAGVISFKNLNSGFLSFSFEKDKNITAETLLNFENVLKQLLEELFNPSIPFSSRES